ncbi:MAG: YkgJ family cysteine cluster protein [Bacteroidota bacterium]|nr:YkgJ family cysteine cluster protein [Bacteroidota bacterium]
MDWSKDPNWKQQSKNSKKVFKKYLNQANPSKIIKLLPELHEEAFKTIDCLDCANCCKNHSPTFKSTDIKRISKHLGLKETQLIENYLKLDEDNDWVLKSSPCTFLNPDNTCQIYDVRPSDCARYPFTDEDVFIKRPHLTLSNSVVCPAVYKILKKLVGEV